MHLNLPSSDAKRSPRCINLYEGGTGLQCTHQVHLASLRYELQRSKLTKAAALEAYRPVYKYTRMRRPLFGMSGRPQAIW